MSVDPDLTDLLVRNAIGYPRGVLGAEARAFAAAIVGGAAGDEADALRLATSRAHWDELRLSIGAAIERAAEGPVAERALEAALDPDPTNPLALALADDAARSLAAMVVRNAERLAVLEGRLAEGVSGGGEMALVVGAIVVDLLDLDHDDYEDEIAAYLADGESDAARRELARATGDEDSRVWAREELRGVDDAAAPNASGAVRLLAQGEPPEDPANDPVWVATMMALVEQAVEIAVVRDAGEEDGDG